MDHRAAPGPNRATGKSQRVLACQLCQQRKVKCDRKYPCANCTRAGTPCVPATVVPRQRRRRFPEHELLTRIRHYETLLRQHNVPFDPLHPPAASTAATETTGDSSPADVVTPDTPRTTHSEGVSQEKATKARTTSVTPFTPLTAGFTGSVADSLQESVACSKSKRKCIQKAT
jgi:hypothetical protein